MNTRGAFDLVICGGGASAVMLIHALAKHTVLPLEIALVERRPHAGLGRAYSTPSEVHFLNVRVSNMSADAHDRDHLLRWLNEEAPAGGHWTPAHFAPRKLYGEYLKAVLHRASDTPNINIAIFNAAAHEIAQSEQGWQVHLEGGKSLGAGMAVLATGNEAPAAIGVPGAAQAGERIIADPWDTAAKAKIASTDDVLLLGTGLTAVDLIADLVVGGHTGKIVALSRHALLPQSHRAQSPDPCWIAPPFPRPLEFLRRLRAELAEAGEYWQSRFDALRPVTQAIWQSWAESEKRRFLRHAKTHWNVHRHRIPPETAGRMAGALAQGKLALMKGRLRKLEPRKGGLRVTVEHAGQARTVETSWLINCTEPNPNPARSPNPLIANLIAGGLGRPGPLGLGLDVTASSQAVSRDGVSQKSLFALGPLTVGRFWEIVAVPDIRVQADAMARDIAARAAQRRAS